MIKNPLWMGFVLFRKGKRSWYFLFLLGLFCFARFTKGAGFADVFSFISRPFWPGPAQSEWIRRASNLEDKARISLLEKDNQRLREMLSLKQSARNNFISAAVIARRTRGWWHQIELGKGNLDGVNVGNSVVAPGGLIGIVQSTTSTTSKVRLLTAPGSRIGVWLPRTKKHAVLIGIGTNRPYVNFLDKDPKVQTGDLLSTSPASTLMSPNIPVGLIKFISEDSFPSPKATVQLLAAPETIDWAQIKIK